MVTLLAGSLVRVAVPGVAALAACFATALPPVAGAATRQAPLSLRPTGADAVGGVLADGDGRLALVDGFDGPVTAIDPVRGVPPKAFAPPCARGRLADFHRGELLWTCPAPPADPVPPDVRPGFVTDIRTGATTSLPDPRPASPRFLGIVGYGQIGSRWAGIDLDGGRGVLRMWIDRTTGEIREDVTAPEQRPNPDSPALTSFLCATVRRPSRPQVGSVVFTPVPLSASRGWYAAEGSLTGEGGVWTSHLMRCGHPPIRLSPSGVSSSGPVVGPGFAAWTEARIDRRGFYGPAALLVRSLRSGRTRRLDLGPGGTSNLYVAGPRLYVLVGRSLKRVALGRL